MSNPFNTSAMRSAKPLSLAREYTFDDWQDMMTDTHPIEEWERNVTAKMQERLRSATGDDARALARAIIRGRHDDGGEA